MMARNLASLTALTLAFVACGGGGENGVNDSPTDVMGVSLEQVKADCNNKGFLIIDFGSIEDTVGIVDFGYI